MNIRLLLFAFLSIFTIAANGQSVGIIGSSTPTGWDSDTDMIQSTTDPNIYTISITLIDGAAKFRQDDAWDINWGSMDFPVGTGVQGGDDIPVFAGDYDVTFDISTGAYSFEVISDVGIIGAATPKGWDEDTDMYIDTNGNYFIQLPLVVGPAKFRQDNDWAVNWGAEDFPSGTGTQDGADIPVDKAGDYLVTFNKNTGEYNFEEIITYSSVSIIGSATPGGEAADTDLTQSASSPEIWEGSFALTDGSLTFRANGTSDINWSSSDFPTGVGVQDGDAVPITAGDYSISLNTETGEYTFLEIIDFATVGIIGDATPGGWDADTPMEKNGSDYTLRVILTDGELKFRADADWATNWGSGDFPMGVGTQDGANVPVVAGEYIISFNSVTGAYLFEEIVVYNSVGIIGTGSPTMNWDEDTDLIKNGSNEFLFTLNATMLFDGEAKFRVDDDWAVNWGAEEFPIGTGTQDGANIMVTAGIYDISLVTDTGEYAFLDPSSTKDSFDPSAVKIYPNPATSMIRFEMDDDRITGDVEVIIIDMSGRIVISTQINTFDNPTINVSALSNGNYSVQLKNGKNLVGKKLTIVK